MTSAIDIGAGGSPLVHVAGSLLAQSAVDVRRSCDGVVFRYVLDGVEAAQARKATGLMVI
jgi:hypothetical protein